MLWRMVEGILGGSCLGMKRGEDGHYGGISFVVVPLEDAFCEESLREGLALRKSEACSDQRTEAAGEYWQRQLAMAAGVVVLPKQRLPQVVPVAAQIAQISSACLSIARARNQLSQGAKYKSARTSYVSISQMSRCSRPLQSSSTHAHGWFCCCDDV